MAKNILLVLALMTTVAYADQYIFDSPTPSASTSNKVNNSQIDVNRTFATFTEAVNKLNSLGFYCTVSLVNQSDPINQMVKFSGTQEQLVQLIAQKFNYTVTINGTNVVFKAMYPPQPKPKATNAIVNDLTKDSPVVVANNWDYSINDKYISTTLGRWAHQAGYQLIWQSDNDFEVQSSGSVKGLSFKAAVNEVLKSFRSSEHPLKAEWYKNNVVVISNFGG